MMARDIKYCFVGVIFAFVFVSNVYGQTLNVQGLTNGLTVEEKRQMLASLRQTLSRIRAARQNLNTNPTANARQPLNTNDVRQPANVLSRRGPAARPRQPATGFPRQQMTMRNPSIQSQQARMAQQQPMMQPRRPVMSNGQAAVQRVPQRSLQMDVQGSSQNIAQRNSQLFLKPNPQKIPQRNVQLTIDGNPQTSASRNPTEGPVRTTAGTRQSVNNNPAINRNMIPPRNRIAMNSSTNTRRPMPQSQGQPSIKPSAQNSQLTGQRLMQTPGQAPGPRMFPKQLPPPSDTKRKNVGISVQVKRKTEVKKIPGSPTGPSGPRVPPKIKGPGSASTGGHGASMVPPNAPVPTAPAGGRSRSPAMTSTGQRPVPTSPSRPSNTAGRGRTTMMRTPPTQPPTVTIPRFIRWDTLYPSGKIGTETAEALAGQGLVLVTSEQVPMFDEFQPSSTLMDFNKGIAAIRVDMPSGGSFMPTTTQVCFTMKNPATMRDTKKELLRRSKSKMPVEHGEVIHMVAAAKNIQNTAALQRTAGPFVSKFCEMALMTNNVYKLVPEAPIEPGPQTITVSGLVTALDPGRSLPVNIGVDTAINFFGPNNAVTSPP